MPRLLEPLLSFAVQITPSVSVLTAIDIDLGLERSGLAANIFAIEGAWDAAAYVTADDISFGVVARPDYAVVSATDIIEGFKDPDWIGGEAFRFSVVTEGGGVVPSSKLVTVPGPGYLVTRRMSALVFSDNASIAWVVRVYYQLAVLSTSEIESFFFSRR